MNTEDNFDAETAVASVIANRPPFLDRAEINEAHIAWAVVQLEGHGLHPSPALIVRVIGRGTQRTLKPFVNAFYRKRGQSPEAPSFDAHDEAVRDLYEVIARHTRQDLQNEFCAEAARIEDAQHALDEMQAGVDAKLTLASERLHAAEALGESIRHELDEGRRERVVLQAQLDHAVQEGARSTQAQEDLQQRLCAAADDCAVLQARVEELYADANAVRANLTVVEDRLLSSERSATDLALERDELRSRASMAGQEACTERGKSQELQRRVGELTAVELRLRERLNAVQSRLSRERSIRETLDRELQTERSSADAQKRDAAVSAKRVIELQRVIDAAKIERVSLEEQLNVSRQEGRRLQAKLLRLGRANL